MSMKKKLTNKWVLIIFCLILLGILYIDIQFQTQNMPQSSIVLLNDATVPKAGQRMLVFSPHPDDETLGAGGLIAEAINNKAEVKIVLITDGNKHGRKDTRYAEFKKATAMLGVPENNLVYLGYQDGRLNKQNEAKLFQVFKQQIDDYKPDFVVYPEKADTHPDHATAGRIIGKVMLDENQSIINYKYLVHYSFFPAHFSYSPNMFLLPPWRLINNNEAWQKLMLPTDVEGLKNQAVRVYQSQIRNHVPFNADMMLSPVRKNELFETKN